MRAGRLIAFAYLFCVLAPAAALAWGHGPAPCLADDVLPVAVAPGQHHMAADHMHAGGAMHEHAAMHDEHHAAAPDVPAPHHHGGNGKGAPGPCCAMMCVTALPAELPSVARPIRPMSACAPEIAVQLHSEAPPLLYRPPIA